MSELVYHEINPHKKNWRYHISYNSAETILSEVKDYFVKSKKFSEQLSNTQNVEILITKENEPTRDLEEEIVTMSFDGFEFDLNKMEPDKIYHITYDGSHYEVLKNKKGELVISEIG